MVAEIVGESERQNMQALTKPNNIEAVIPLVISDVASRHTKTAYTAELRRFFAWVETNRPPDGFARSTVLAYRDGMREAGRGPVSINLALSAIRKLARVAADADLMDQGIAGRIDAVAGLPRGDKQRLGNWLTLEQLKMLLAAPPPTTPNRGLRDRAAIWIMGACGLRREEAAGLQVKNLQVRDGRPALVDFKGKGDKFRTVPIHHLADAAIRAWMAHAGIIEPEEYILTTVANPDRLTKRQADGARLYDACKRYCAAFSLQFRPHDLRRTFAALARKGGADLESIQMAMGHANLVTTSMYLSKITAMENAAADRIEL